MKRFIRAVIPYLTAVLILAGGSGMTLMVRSLLPDHTGVVRTYDVGTGSAYRVESENDLYPWDILSEDDPLLTDWLEENSLRGDMSLEETVNYTVGVFAGGEHPAGIIREVDSRMQIHLEDGAIYIYAKELPYTTYAGEEYTASAVWRNDSLICLELKNASEPVRVSADDSAAVMAHLVYLRNSSYSGYGGEAVEEDADTADYSETVSGYENPIGSAMINIMTLFSDGQDMRRYTVYELIMYGSTYTVEMNGQVLLVLTGNGSTLVLEYDPLDERVTGFSLKDV